MYFFHQRHYSCLTFAVSYGRNIFKDVTNRNDIKAATMKVCIIAAVLNFPRKRDVCSCIGVILSVYVWAGRCAR